MASSERLNINQPVLHLSKQFQERWAKSCRPPSFWCGFTTEFGNYSIQLLLDSIC